MAEVGAWLGSIAIGKLQDMVRSYIDKQFEYQAGAESNLRKLDKSFTKIQAVVSAAEKREIEDPSLLKWLNDLKDAVRNAEDVLDLFEYQFMEDEAEGKGSVVVVKEESKSKVRSFFNLCNCYKLKKDTRTVVKRLFFMDEDLNDLIAVVNEFDDLVAGMGDLLKLVKLDSSHNSNKHAESIPDWRKTSYFSEESKVFGRRNETEKLLNSILGISNTSEADKKNYSIVSIVGIGGMGKTTLAQSIYNNPSVQDHFDVKAWVCVSDKFNVQRITIEIIESASLSRQSELTSISNLGIIQEILKKGIEGKKFFIVLDDVWNEVSSNWESLSKPFRFARNGSKVIVTTRSIKVANIMGTKGITINLRSLEVEEFWELFKQYAFDDANPKDYPKLEMIGRDIANKLGGLPLAAKTVGRALHYDLKEQHWNDILHSKFWEIEQEEDGIVPALKLSYNHLPKHLKQCFLYCCLFPKDYQFDQDKLINLWMALDYVKPKNSNNRLEDEGRKYFEELVSRSFFQKAQSSDHHVIHDLLHDLAQYIYGDEVCQIEDDEELIKIPERVRHLYVNSKNLDKILDNVSTLKRLRSLISAHEGPWSLSEATLKKLKGLRILILHGYQNGPFTLPEEISFLKLLRYLEFNLVARFPESLGKLYHLQVFRCACLSVQWETRILPTMSLPKGMSKLIKLRWIDANENLVARMIGIGQVTSLQVLKKFKVTKEEGRHINELKNLRQIRDSLAIHGLENVEVVEEAAEAQLQNKEHLEDLELSWSTFPFDRYTCEEEQQAAEHDKEVLEALRPHGNLKRLGIHDYWGIICATWLGSKKWSSNLETIRLTQCKFLEVLPPLGQLPFLKVLALYKLDSLKLIDSEFYGEDEMAFPSLEKLDLAWLPELMGWSLVEDGRQVFPQLREFKITKCPKLRGPIPFRSLLSSLSTGVFVVPESSCMLKLHIDGCLPVLVGLLPSNSLGYLQTLVFEHIETFSDEQNEWLQKLTSLNDLSFNWCSNLMELPDAVKCLSSLEMLTVQRCGEIQSLPELPGGLKELHIIGSDKLKQQYDMKEGGGGWPEISHIPTVNFDS